MTAEQLNSHLASGGLVYLATMTRRWLYNKKHAGWFSDRKDGLYVQQGRGVVFLGRGGRLVGLVPCVRAADGTLERVELPATECKS